MKVGDADFERLISDPLDYEGKINHIEIPHGSCKQRPEALTEADRVILRYELGELTWVARLSPPGAIRDASASAKTSTEGRIGDSQNEIEMVLNSQEYEKVRRKIISDFEHMPGYMGFLSKNQSGVNKVGVSK